MFSMNIGTLLSYLLIVWLTNLLTLLSFEDPDWASYTLGIFVCLNCSGTHRNLPSISRIKSIRLDFWDDELVQVKMRLSAKRLNDKILIIACYSFHSHCFTFQNLVVTLSHEWMWTLTPLCFLSMHLRMRSSWRPMETVLLKTSMRNVSLSFIISPNQMIASE